MSSTNLTQVQVQQVVAVLTANPSNPAATWAALSLYGDQYATAALQGLTNAQSFYGQVISNSNLNAGVSGDQRRLGEKRRCGGRLESKKASQRFS
jgi:hypothetical protein